MHGVRQFLFWPQGDSIRPEVKTPCNCCFKAFQIYYLLFLLKANKYFCSLVIFDISEEKKSSQLVKRWHTEWMNDCKLWKKKCSVSFLLIYISLFFSCKRDMEGCLFGLLLWLRALSALLRLALMLFADLIGWGASAILSERPPPKTWCFIFENLIWPQRLGGHQGDDPFAPEAATVPSRHAIHWLAGWHREQLDVSRSPRSPPHLKENGEGGGGGWGRASMSNKEESHPAMLSQGQAWQKYLCTVLSEPWYVYEVVEPLHFLSITVVYLIILSANSSSGCHCGMNLFRWWPFSLTMCYTFSKAQPKVYSK